MLFLALLSSAQASSSDPLTADIEEQRAFLGHEALLRHEHAGNNNIIGERQTGRGQQNRNLLRQPLKQAALS